MKAEINISDCIDTAEDLLPGFIVVIDEASGVIQAILNFSHIDGTHEGTRC